MTIRKADDQVLRALTQVDSHIVEWLQKSLNDTRIENDNQLDEALLRQVQGSAQTLQELLDKIEKSKELVHRH